LSVGRLRAAHHAVRSLLLCNLDLGVCVRRLDERPAAGRAESQDDERDGIDEAVDHDRAISHNRLLRFAREQGRSFSDIAGTSVSRGRGHRE
jgi:hypothetical protein